MSKIRTNRFCYPVGWYCEQIDFKGENLENLDIIDFAHFLVSSVSPELQKSSWRAYKSDFRFFFKDNPDLPKIEAILNQAKPESTVKKTTSLRRKKITHFDLKMFHKLVSIQASNGRTRQGAIVICWLRAIIFTGLRPREWRTASLSENNILKVRNIKLSKCVQASWSDRFLDLAYLDDASLEDIHSTLAIMNKLKDENEYNKFAKKSADWLHTANKDLFPRRKLSIGLLSGRHQFIANLKASGRYSPVEIAYLVGHANDKRAFESYAPASSGYTGVGLPTIPDDKRDLLQHVRLKLDDKIERRAANLEAKNNGPGVT